MDNSKVPFNSLPVAVQESLLWEMILDFDKYESSVADTIHCIMVGSHCSPTNKLIIANYYKALSDESLAIHLTHVMEDANHTIDGIDKIRDMLKKA